MSYNDDETVNFIYFLWIQPTFIIYNRQKYFDSSFGYSSYGLRIDVFIPQHKLDITLSFTIISTTVGKWE